MPLHPGLVHYPIALVVLAAGFQFLAILFRKGYLTISAFIVLGFAALAAIAAAVSGSFQESAVATLPGIHTHLERHELLGTIAAFALCLGGLSVLYLYLRGRLPAWLFLGVLTILAALLVVTGHYGGVLVYHYGAGVELQPNILPPALP